MDRVNHISKEKLSLFEKTNPISNGAFQSVFAYKIKKQRHSAFENEVPYVHKNLNHNIRNVLMLFSNTCLYTSCFGTK